MAKVHQLDCDLVHYTWNNAIPPRLEIDSGDTVVFQCRDAADGFYNRSSTSENVGERPFRGHPLTGPVLVRGARPADALRIDVLALSTGDLGWTSISPGRGLLSEEFPDRYLKLWELGNRTHTMMGGGIRVPVDPFLGVMGVALAEPGDHITMPPRKNGGNMDVKQVTVGSTLYLPVWVDGALFSCGDGHAAQGDGEVCVTAIETTMSATLRLSVVRGLNLEAPQLETTVRNGEGRHHVTIGIAPDLMDAAKDAVRAMIRHLMRSRAMARQDAYVLCSVAADLRISEVVDAPNWVVSAFLPLSLFDQAAHEDASKVGPDAGT